MKKIKVGIIGCGNIAHATHIPNYINSDRAEIKYFCDIIPEKAESAVEKYGCGKAVVDYHDILNDPELDAVSVCTHNDMHSIISIDFMKAGKD
ncbi:MAG: Gfo/Idh/MocA family oxidoreductase, partial [Oscillospiraceae bacterium]